MLRTGNLPTTRLFLYALAAALAGPLAAHAMDLEVKVEPGFAFPLTTPQRDRFNPGGAVTAKGLLSAEGGYVSLEAGITELLLPASSDFTSGGTGTAFAPSLGLRFKKPREALDVNGLRHEQGFFNKSRPWVDGDVMYVRTGGLDRLGVAAAVGVLYPVGERQSFWMGPFVRFLQIAQGNRAGYDNSSSNTLIVGLSFETGAQQRRPEPTPVVERVVVADCPQPVVRLDRDRDGVPDDIDACPDMPGPASNAGCPVYEKVVVQPDKLELKEKIQFAWNTGHIDPVSHPLLDEVVKALHDNPGFRVAIEGHASSEGHEPRNQLLSDARGAAVLEYLADHGVARSRLVSKGVSSSEPIASDATEAGREANRRVDFTVYFIIIKEGDR